jgi:hypothetical protein
MMMWKNGKLNVVIKKNISILLVIDVEVMLSEERSDLPS